MMMHDVHIDRLRDNNQYKFHSMSWACKKKKLFKASKLYLHVAPLISNKDFRLVGYCDADYARDKVERKNISGGCHYIRHCLISLASKKQNSIALSSTEVEYVFATRCRSQLLWV